MSKGGQGTTQQARGSFSGNSQPSYGGNQATGLGSKGGSQSYQQPYRSPYGQGQSYSQHGMRSGFGDFMENPQAMPPRNPNFSQPDGNGNFTSLPSGGQIVIEPPNSLDQRRREEIRTRGPESLAAQGQFGDASAGAAQNIEANDPFEFQSPPQLNPEIHLRTRGPESLVEQGGMAYTQGPVSTEEQQQQQFGGLLSQGASPNSYNNNFGPYVGNAGGFANKGGQARQMGYAPMRQGLGGFF